MRAVLTIILAAGLCLIATTVLAGSVHLWRDLRYS